jgi:hypothetical protein
METREEERLAHVDVAESGDARLVEKEGLERPSGRSKERPEPSGGVGAAERFQAERPELGLHALLPA